MEDNILDSDFFDIDEKELTYYRDFYQFEEAKAYQEILKKAHIPYSFETTQTIIDSSIVGTSLLPNIILKLRPKDFKKVNAIIQQKLSDIDLSDIGDHYLTEFEDEELVEILYNPDDWSIEDFVVARKILDQRGITFNKEELSDLRASKLEKVREGKQGNRVWMLIYSLFILLGLFFSELFVIAGMGMSYYYAYGKNTDPDGNRYYVYDTNTRALGVFMFYGGLMAILVELFLFYYILQSTR